MRGDRYEIGAYKGPCQESAGACAARMARMLTGLAEAHPAFERWYRLANSRSKVLQPFCAIPPRLDELTEIFVKGTSYTDYDPKPIPELGYTVNAWNGQEDAHASSLTVRAGGYGTGLLFPNVIALKLPRYSAANDDLLDASVLKSVLQVIATAWEPDSANVVTWDYWKHLLGPDGHLPIVRSGWMTYLSPDFARRITPPPSAIVDPVEGGGTILTATDELFTAENPAHVAAADAIQAALAPLQNLRQLPFVTPHGRAV